MANSVEPLSLPAGLEAIYRTCLKIYDTQPNPLQLSPAVKYWLGGPDPLDFVSVFWSAGDRRRNVPANWHYVSCGLSNLYGDNRTLQRCRVPLTLDEGASGFGFELTFRLQCAWQDREQESSVDVGGDENARLERESRVQKPPKWPAALLNSIARYVLQTGTPICAGDEIPWNTSLNKSGVNDGEASGVLREQNAEEDHGKVGGVADEEDSGLESRIRHLLVCEDVQLASIRTPYGMVRFLQLVGVTDDELFAAQNWTAFGVMQLMRSYNSSASASSTSARYSNAENRAVARKEAALFGGDWLVTNLRRRKSLLDESQCKIRLLEAIESDGSNLSGIIVTRLSWTATVMDESATRRRRYMDGATSMECEVQQCSEVELELNAEAARFLPLAIRGRLRHGRHFTLTNVPNNDEPVSVTFVCHGVAVADGIVDRRRRFAIVNSNWLHVYLSSSMFDELLRELGAIGIQSTLFAAPAAQTQQDAAKVAANRKRTDSLLEKLKRRLGRHSLTDSTPEERTEDDKVTCEAHSGTSSKSASEASGAGSNTTGKDSGRTRSAGSGNQTYQSGSGSGTATSNSKRSGEAQGVKVTQTNASAGLNNMSTRVLSWPHYGMRIRINC